MSLNVQQCVYLVLAFATGFAVNRYMNHQDIITGETKEGIGVQHGDPLDVLSALPGLIVREMWWLIGLAFIIRYLWCRQGNCAGGYWSWTW